MISYICSREVLRKNFEEDEKMSSISDRRRDMGMLQIELAEKVGVRQETMCRIEMSKQVPSYYIAARIMEALGEKASFEPVEYSHEDFYIKLRQGRAFKSFNVHAVKKTLQQHGVLIDTKNYFGGESDD